MTAIAAQMRHDACAPARLHISLQRVRLSVLDSGMVA
jgi:hypothetical protein